MTVKRRFRIQRQWHFWAVLSLCVLSALSSAADSARPVYVIAHRCNGLDSVKHVVANQEVNGIEADFSYGRPTSGTANRWVVDHDGVFAGSTDLDSWLTRIAVGAPTLSLIILDLKDPGGPLGILYDKVRASLPRINLLFSVGDYAERLQFSKIRERINADPRAGVAIDDDASPDLVRGFFAAHGFRRAWYADGYSILVTPPSVKKNVAAALRLRGDSSAIKGVYTWTYERESSIKEYLDMGVDAIMVNANECSGIWGLGGWRPLDSVMYARTLPGRRYATRSDNPFGPSTSDAPLDDSDAVLSILGLVLDD